MNSKIQRRPFKPEDAKNVVSCVSGTPRDLFYFSSQFEFPLTEQKFLKHYESHLNEESHVAFSFFSPEGQHVGHCELKAISRVHLNSTIAHVLISPDVRGRGFGCEMLKAMVRYAFEERQLNRVGLAVATENSKAIALYLRTGFEVEGLIRDVLKFDGQFFSLYQMSILRRNWAERSQRAPL